MSQQKSGAAVGATHGEEFPEGVVADYLKSHQDFFERHPLVLLSLKLPHRTGGSAILMAFRPDAGLAGAAFLFFMGMLSGPPRGGKDPAS